MSNNSQQLSSAAPPWGMFWKSARLLWRVCPSDLTIHGIATVSNGLLPLVTMWVSARLFALAAKAALVPTNELDRKQLVLWLVAFAGVTVVTYFAGQFCEVYRRAFQTKASYAVQRLIIQKAASQPLDFFDNSKTYNEIQQLFRDASYRPFVVVYQMFSCLSHIALATGTFTLIVAWKWWLAPILFVTPAISYRISKYMATVMGGEASARQKDEMRAQYVSGILLSDMHAAEVRTLRLERFFVDKAAAIWDTLTSRERALANRRLKGDVAWIAVLNLDRAASFGFVLLQLVQGKVSLTQFGVYTQALVAFQSSLRDIATGIGQMAEHRPFLQALDDFLARSEPAPTLSAIAGINRSKGVPEIEFTGVSFHYPGTDQLVLKNVSFSILAGQTIAVAGRNGAGKSTLVKLLSGLYSPTEGQIRIRGKDIRQISREEMSQYVSIMMQDFNIYHLTAAENIGVGDVTRISDRQAIERAALDAGLDKIFAGIPLGYDSIMGRFIERGLEFSGGQRQLIALARAYMRPAPILVMDEPTSALDRENERAFLNHLLSGDRAGRSCAIVISHRLSAIEHCTRVLVLENGRLVDDGNPLDLIAAGGPYAKLWADSEHKDEAKEGDRSLVNS